MMEYMLASFTTRMVAREDAVGAAAAAEARRFVLTLPEVVAYDNVCHLVPTVENALRKTGCPLLKEFLEKVLFVGA